MNTPGYDTLDMSRRTPAEYKDNGEWTLYPATDGSEVWHGMRIDKTKYSIVFEDETEESVVLRIVQNKEKE